MNKIQGLRLILSAALVCVLASTPAKAAEPTLLIDRIIAVVGEDVVMLSELRIEATKLQMRLKEQGRISDAQHRSHPEAGI